jgi:RasGEF domain
MNVSNFFSVFAIYAGLSLAPVQRLHKTWEGISAKTKQIYDEVEKFCDPSRNMKAYRDVLAACHPPILPFLPIYMKDLTFMNDGNPSLFKNMINFDKLRMMATRVKDVTSLALTPPQFEKVPAIQNYLHKPKIEQNVQKLKEESVALEG